MLTKFRNLYPQGSILSELIDIDRGLYIVKVSIQIDGVILATGLAGANVVEKAEDQARNRALQALVLEDGHLSLNLAPKASQTLPTSSSPRLTTTTANREPSPPAAVEKVEQLANSAIANSVTATVPQEEMVTAPAQVPFNSREENSLLREEEASVDSKNLLNTEPSEPEVMTELLEQETPTSIPEYPDNILDLKPPEENYESEATSVPEPPADFDFNQIRHKIDLEMKRLNWTKEQGRDYLLSTYGKRSRLHLTDNELLEFWHYLETLPN